MSKTKYNSIEEFVSRNKGSFQSIGVKYVRKTDRFTYDDFEFGARMKTCYRNANPFCEHIKGQRVKIYRGSHFMMSKEMTGIDLGGINGRQFSSFLGVFTKNLHKQFESNPSLYDKKITFIGSNKKAYFKSVWDDVEVGDYFFDVDIKNAYWQALRKLGYIDSRLYNRYLEQDEYKKAKRFCVSFLKRTNKVNYYYPMVERPQSKSDYGVYTINCDNTLYSKIFANVCNEVYNTIYYAMKDVDSDKIISYNTDNVVVIGKENVDKIKRAFNKFGYLYKNSICKKISESEYTRGGKIRTFR